MALKINSASGSITLTAEDGSGNADVSIPRAGIGSVDNLGDLSLSASATEINYLSGVTSSVQNQLDSKIESLSDLSITASSTELNYVDGVTSAIQTQINAKAPTASPTFTGTPAAPTAAAGTNTTQLATTAFVTTAVNNVVDSAPGALDTLNELAAALGDDANFSTTVTNNLATKAPLASPTFSGTVSDGDGDMRAIPQSGSAKTSSYTLATGDVGNFIEVGSSGSITIPNSTFSAGDAVSIFNNTTGDVTITCSITTAYIGGADADVASVTLATRGVCTVLFISATVCVITGNIS
jgi:hypothetical protein